MQAVISLRRQYSHLLTGLALFCCIGSAHAAETDLLRQISQQIKQHNVVRANFSQSKQMAALKRPLLTHGKLLYSSSHGVMWQIEQPYRITYLLGEDKIIEIAADGSRKQRGARDIPGLAQVGRVFRALLGADIQTLQNHFTANVEGNAAQWKIVLQPKQAQVQQFLTQLKLNGGRFVDNIDIDEASGDRTHIRFTSSSAVSSPNPEELQLLESLKTP